MNFFKSILIFNISFIFFCNFYPGVFDTALWQERSSFIESGDYKNNTEKLSKILTSLELYISINSDNIKKNNLLFIENFLKKIEEKEIRVKEISDKLSTLKINLEKISKIVAERLDLPTRHAIFFIDSNTEYLRPGAISHDLVSALIQFPDSIIFVKEGYLFEQILYLGSIFKQICNNHEFLKNKFLEYLQDPFNFKKNYFLDHFLDNQFEDPFFECKKGCFLRIKDPACLVLKDAIKKSLFEYTDKILMAINNIKSLESWQDYEFIDKNLFKSPISKIFKIFLISQLAYQNLNQWKIFKHNVDGCYILAKNIENLDLSDYSEQNLNELEREVLQKIFNSSCSFNLNDFQHKLISISDKTFLKNCRWTVFLDGHGIAQNNSAGIISGIIFDLKRFERNFLKTFIKNFTLKNANFFIINSCYSSFNKEVLKDILQDLEKSNYEITLIINSILDSATGSDLLNNIIQDQEDFEKSRIDLGAKKFFPFWPSNRFDNFYQELDGFINLKNSQDISIKDEQLELKKISLNLNEYSLKTHTNRPELTSQISFPHFHSDPAKVLTTQEDRMQLITVFDENKHELMKNLYLKEEYKFFVKDKSLLIIYPEEIKTQIIMEGKLPVVISGLTGNFLHVINEIITDSPDFETFLSKTFASKNVLDIPTVSNKIFFIKILKIKTEAQELEIKDLLINTRPFFCYYKDFQDKVYKTSLKSLIFQQLDIISEEFRLYNFLTEVLNEKTDNKENFIDLILKNDRLPLAQYFFDLLISKNDSKIISDMILKSLQIRSIFLENLLIIASRSSNVKNLFKNLEEQIFGELKMFFQNNNLPISEKIKIDFVVRVFLNHFDIYPNFVSFMFDNIKSSYLDKTYFYGNSFIETLFGKINGNKILNEMAYKNFSELLEIIKIDYAFNKDLSLNIIEQSLTKEILFNKAVEVGEEILDKTENFNDKFYQDLAKVIFKDLIKKIEIDPAKAGALKDLSNNLIMKYKEKSVAFPKISSKINELERLVKFEA